MKIHIRKNGELEISVYFFERSISTFGFDLADWLSWRMTEQTTQNELKSELRIYLRNYARENDLTYEEFN
jgi:hypothetical protein